MYLNPPHNSLVRRPTLRMNNMPPQNFVSPHTCAHVPWATTTVPPDILDYPTSTDMLIREGSNVTLKCAATGSPTPTITWRREGGELIPLPNGAEGELHVAAALSFIAKHFKVTFLCAVINLSVLVLKLLEHSNKSEYHNLLY